MGLGLFRKRSKWFGIIRLSCVYDVVCAADPYVCVCVLMNNLFCWCFYCQCRKSKSASLVSQTLEIRHTLVWRELEEALSVWQYLPFYVLLLVDFLRSRCKVLAVGLPNHNDKIVHEAFKRFEIFAAKSLSDQEVYVYCTLSFLRLVCSSKAKSVKRWSTEWLLVIRVGKAFRLVIVT